MPKLKRNPGSKRRLLGVAALLLATLAGALWGLSAIWSGFFTVGKLGFEAGNGRASVSWWTDEGLAALKLGGPTHSLRRTELSYWNWSTMHIGPRVIRGTTVATFDVTLCLWLPMVLLVIAGGHSLQVGHNARRTLATLCPQCHYDLHGLPPGSLCPECGKGA